MKEWAKEPIDYFFRITCTFTRGNDCHCLIWRTAENTTAAMISAPLITCCKPAAARLMWYQRLFSQSSLPVCYLCDRFLLLIFLVVLLCGIVLFCFQCWLKRRQIDCSRRTVAVFVVGDLDPMDGELNVSTHFDIPLTNSVYCGSWNTILYKEEF